MELIKDTPFEVAWLVWQNSSSKHCLTVIIKGTYELVDSGECPIAKRQQLPTGDIHHDGDPEASIRTESDFAFIKPKGECFVVGSCYAPGGKAAPVVLSAFKIGRVSKKIAVIGDRHFQGLIAKQTEPEPFEVMPLCWERAFGGAKSAGNPVGLGLDKVPFGEKKKRYFPLPNLEDPAALIRSRRQAPPPMGFFPIPKAWKQRTDQAGSYGRGWLKTSWPWLPRDFQWRYFNAAPADQQISGYFKGDESISLTNLHPQHQRVNCQLPGRRATALLFRADGAEPDALRPDLDTITVDTDSGMVTCLWRAIIEVGSESLEEYSELFVVDEELQADLSIEEYEAWLGRRKEELAAEEMEAEPQAAPDIPEVRADDVGPVVIPTRKETGATAQEEYEVPVWGGPPADGTMSIRPVPVPLDSPTVMFKQPPEEDDPLLGSGDDVEATVQSFIAGEETDNVDMRLVMTLIAEEKEAQMEELSFQERLDEAAALLGDMDEQPATEEDQIPEPEPFHDGKTQFRGMSTSFLQGLGPGKRPDAAEVPVTDEDFHDGQTMYKGQSTDFLAGLGPGKRPDAAEAPEADGDFHDGETMYQGQSTDFLAGLGPGKRPEAVEPPAAEAGDEDGKSETPDSAWFGTPQAVFEDTPGKPEAPEPPVEPAAPVPPVEPAAPLPIVEPTAPVPPMEPAAPVPSMEPAAPVPPMEPAAPVPPVEPAAPDKPPSVDAAAAQAHRLRVEAAVDKGESCAGWDLSDADLSGLELGGVDLSGALLLRADLTEANLDGAKLDDAVLFQAVLKGASIRGTSFSGANLQDVDASGATLEDLQLDLLHGNGLRLREAKILRCSASRAELIAVDLTGARVEQTSFDGADLSESKLDGSLFTDCTLVDTDISGATTARNVVMDECDLTKLRASDGVDLTEASMVKAKLDEGRFGSATLVRANLAFATLERADFSGADMTTATLLGCRLASSRFDGATLVETRFGKSDMPSVRFEGASLLRTDLRGCNLYGAEFFEARMEGVQLELANVKGTKLA